MAERRCRRSVMGFSSIACHATFTRIGFFLDFGAIPTMINFTAAYCFSTFEFPYGPSRFSHSKLVLYCAGLSIPQAVLVWFFIDQVKYVMMAISSIALLTLFILRLRQRIQGRPIFLFLAALFFLVGVPVFSLDLMRPYCWPITLLHSHTAWHILAAFGTFFSYKYFESEVFKK